MVTAKKKTSGSYTKDEKEIKVHHYKISTNHKGRQQAKGNKTTTKQKTIKWQ